ncbi:hydrogen gas-evolving membrane-bound hydrogenase subunit E [Roseomonas sp. KE0001]|uniref:hydrogen gas-evolving membrane-bound hydrogenase subunit E n=1 Tax=Roseomonas sp. KE0001 TaxID=2479201 RepID=UPI001E301338|nr:hydrogen gas-evolving membrane-bound hydrogenase subunit E [Roseomonas sp. KE0001]
MSIGLLLGLAVLGALLAAPVSHLTGRFCGWALGLLPATLFAGFLSMAGTVAGGEVIGVRLPWAPSLGIDLDFRLDGFSLLFALLITGIGALVVVYSGAYMAEKQPTTRARFLTLILLFMTAMLGAVLSDNLISLFVFWELTSLLSFLLIGFESHSPTARRSAIQSLLVTAGGGLALLAGILLIGATLGSFSLSEAAARSDEILASPWRTWIILFVLLGAFTKSAQYPFYFWLPNAMQAPTPASAYLHSATMVKLGIYLLARFELVLGDAALYREALVAVGSVTMLVAAIQALRATGFKAVLAYSTVASLGILVMLTGLDGEATVVATVGFILAHAFYKAALFFCAGTVIHATGEATLRKLGGVARFLPLTAAAAVLASLSMAGLPPFMGFISKEVLFEAQLASSWDAAPVVVAVLVNAVMVGIAGVVSLRPFFLNRHRTTTVKHGETPGLLFGPLVLALAGLVFSLWPEGVSQYVIAPAASAIRGEPVEVSFKLWHGLTPMLALSVLVIVVGGLILMLWQPIHAGLRGLKRLDRFSGDHGYEWGMRRLDELAEATARSLQHGDLRRYLATIFATVLLLAGLGLAMSGGLALTSQDRLRPEVLGLLIIGLAGGLTAARADSLLTGLVAVGLVGLCIALIFLLNGAPDLALTQFSVEALLVVLLTATLLRLPLEPGIARSEAERRRDGLLAAGFGLLVFLALQSVLSQPLDTRLSDYFAQASYPEAFGRNVVNVILVDFRAMDTFGETAVLGFAAITVWALLRPPAGQKEDGGGQGSSALVLRAMDRIFFVMLGVASLWILLRGHNEPGGGFIGGLVAALGFAIVALAKGVGAARRLLRLHPLGLAGAGLLFALLSGLPGLALHGAFLQHLWFSPVILGVEVKFGTTLFFDIGVYLVVLGSVLAFLFRLYREPAR